VQKLSPKVLWVGIGCQQGTSSQLIQKAIEQVFQQYQLDYKALVGIATIDTKAGEIGLKEFCRQHNLPLKTFTAETLAAVCVPHPSKIAADKVGTPSVAEAAAILAAGNKEELAVGLLVPKQIFRLPGQFGTVTVAVVQASS
jgi:cobalamin biosynthesis protein CbiG